ncbi:MAG: hypothetical protein JSV78_10755 [Phycisphaerales bacterium]|nr:MAG: hypothetical protein JSV78_10755 [Phycisphaerales bacterium]
MPGDLYCIRRTATVEEADIIVTWLADRGIEAQVVDRDNPGVLAFGLTDAEGIAICVADEETAKKAQALLEEHDREAAAQSKGEGEVEATCEECGTVNTFEASTRGTVQECSECGAYVDVPEIES